MMLVLAFQDTIAGLVSLQELRLSGYFNLTRLPASDALRLPTHCKLAIDVGAGAER